MCFSEGEGGEEPKKGFRALIDSAASSPGAGSGIASEQLEKSRSLLKTSEIGTAVFNVKKVSYVQKFPFFYAFWRVAEIIPFLSYVDQLGRKMDTVSLSSSLAVVQQ
jgi:hypothetical protein